MTEQQKESGTTEAYNQKTITEEIKKAEDRVNSLNTKVNIFIVMVVMLAWFGIGAYWHYVIKLTGLESVCIMLATALFIITLAWLWCINQNTTKANYECYYREIKK